MQVEAICIDNITILLSPNLRAGRTSRNENILQKTLLQVNTQRLHRRIFQAHRIVSNKAVPIRRRFHSIPVLTGRNGKFFLFTGPIRGWNRTVRVSAVREKLADGGLSAWLHDPDKSRGQESHVTCALCVVRAYGFMLLLCAYGVCVTFLRYLCMVHSAS